MSAYVYILNPDGLLLSSDGAYGTDAGDASVWQRVDGKVVNAVSGRRLAAADLADARLVAGPERLPSDHLAELREQGMTVISNVMSPPDIATLKETIAVERAQHHADESPTDGHFWISTGLLWAPELARASSHPLALWLLRQYLDTQEIHYCHQPIITTLKPAGKLLGKHPRGGWHSDYPYHPGVFPDDNWPESPVLGAQFNVCIDPFTPETAGTQFLPGSHRLCRGPSRAFNADGTRMGTGLHRDVRQVVAPAGAAVIYDARTWHRACYELNVSGHDRIAILNAVAPAWVVPMIDKQPITEAYRTAPVPALLNQRERDELERLCHAPVLSRPPGMPELRGRG